MDTPTASATADNPRSFGRQSLNAEPFTAGQVAGHPITNAVELAQYLQVLCGAEGYRFAGELLLALRWDRDGNEIVIDRFLWQVT